MKYSLRSLMIVVTLVCVLLGSVMGRVEYLRRTAAFHKQEAQRYAKRLGIPESFGFPLHGTFLLSIDSTQDDMDAYLHHALLARAFERAKKRPWMPVENPSP